LFAVRAAVAIVSNSRRDTQIELLQITVDANENVRFTFHGVAQ
jgi:hypothetical protein